MTMDDRVRPLIGRLHQFIAVSIFALTSTMYGYGLVWPSYSIRVLNSTESPLDIKILTSTEIALIGSIPSFGGMIGTAPAGYLVQKYGTKRCGIFIGIPMILSWLIKYISVSIIPIYISRIMIGMCGCFGAMIVPVFVADVADTAIRGALSSSMVLYWTMGMFISYISGALFSYDVIIMIAVTLATVYTVALIFIPESPVYLMRMKREKEAARSMSWYRGASINSKLVAKELDTIRLHLQGPVELKEINGVNYGHADGDETEKEVLQKTQENLEKQVSPKQKSEVSTLQFLRTSRSSQRALLSLIALMMLQLMMGMPIVMTFAGQIFADAVPSMSSDDCSILFGGFNVLGCLCAMFAVEKAGRKKLMIVSTSLVAGCLAMIGLVMQFGFGPGWLSAVVLCAYVLIYNLGSGNIPFVWMAEIFLPEVRSISTATCLQCYCLLGGACVAMFEPLKGVLGMNGIFYMFSATSIATVIFTAVMFPETKGLSVEEIHLYFGAKRR